MKIIRLQSIIGLLVWSVVLGVTIGYAVNDFVIFSACQPSPQPATLNSNPALQELTFQEDACIHGLQQRGYPFKYSATSQVWEYPTNNSIVNEKTVTNYADNFALIEIYNYIFWFVVTLIILSVVRYYVYKKVPVKVKLD